VALELILNILSTICLNLQKAPDALLVSLLAISPLIFLVLAVTND
jgi:hypothetical protein